MAYPTNIAWTWASANWWIGCVICSIGCRRCYARAENARRKWIPEDQWIKNGERYIVKTCESQLKKWNNAAKKTGTRRLVFINDLADFFEDNSNLQEIRAHAWKVMCEFDGLDFQLCTKRPQNVAELVCGQEYYNGWPNHIWLGVTAENQQMADLRLPILAELPGKIHYVSAEPLLGPIDFEPYIWRIDQVIVGGESMQPWYWRDKSQEPLTEDEKCARMPREWAEQIRDLCIEHRKCFFFKQWSDNSLETHEKMYRKLPVLGYDREVGVL